MFEIIRQIINYSGQLNVDNSILNVCCALIPVLVCFFIWQITKLISYIVRYGKP